MAASTEQPDNEKVELNDLGKLALKFVRFGGTASQNVMEGLSDMSIYNWIRLIMVVGGYILFRPYVIRIMSGKAVSKMERDDAIAKAAEAELSPNDLRGSGKRAAPEEDEDIHEGEGTGADWGQKARTRQRQFLKNMMEAEERRQQEEEDDKDIADLLED